MNETDIRVALYNALMDLKGCHGTQGYSPRWMREVLYDGTIPELTLDWMHEIEITLTRSRCDDYTSHLLRIVSNQIPIPDGVFWAHSWMVATATAAQRAEAFLRTVGKWVEPSACR